MLHAANASDSEARAAWLWRAVGKGNPQAPVELAKMYEQGNGVVRSCAQASLLLRAASSRGNQQAKLALRQLYYHGGCSAR
jgi:TPR repeat protein